MCQLQLQSNKQRCIYTNTGYRPGRHLNELMKKKEKKEAHFAAVIISVTGVSTEDSKNKGDIQLQ